ncbi:MAG TPA: hypothetical protein VG407_12675 [Caulobacteraceae bacterium]|jgi:hypothetical protein|nr:hypothetical protein [Caulobacteraceae bacterium]
MKARLTFRREMLRPLEAAGERALQVKKRGQRDTGARARALADFEAAKAALGPRFDAYAKALEHMTRTHLRAKLAHALPRSNAPTIASVFGAFKGGDDNGVSE